MEIFTFDCNLNNNKKTYEQFGKLYKLLDQTKNQEIYFDLRKVDFISANLFAVFGACLNSTVHRNCNKIRFLGVKNKIISLMSRNKFGKYFHLDLKNDVYKSCVEYAVFKAKTEQLEEFEKYLLLQIFNHKEIPEMSMIYKNRIIDNFLEIFNNVIDHAEAEYVYVCGQFFPSNQSFVFSIVDIGLTFAQKIDAYFEKYGKESPVHKIEWALKAGNTTKTSSPGGLGLTTLFEFLEYNKGKFSIVSNNEFYKFDYKGKRTLSLSNGFPGTIVTIDVNLRDSNLYLLDTDNDETIVF